MSNANEPAYPNELASPTNDSYLSTSGLTKRELIAAMALQGLLSNPGGPVQSSSMKGWDPCTNCTHAQVAQEANAFADALIAELGDAA